MIKYQIPNIRYQRYSIQSLTLFVLLTVSCFFSLLVGACVAEEVVGSKDLIENSQLYDGRTVIYRGEAVGDIMQRGNYLWINVLDAHLAIGIWAPIKFQPLIRFVGGYTMRGDYLEIEGVFNVRCILHAGELDIHANDIRLITRGEFTPEKIYPQRKQTALYMGLLVLCLMMLAIYKRKR